jgi:hypothetical protein
MTPAGEGKVIDVVPLRLRVLVEIPNVGYREFAKDEVKLIQDVPEQKNQPAAKAETKE